MSADESIHELDGVPEGLLWLRLFEYAEAVAPEIHMTPSAWMHTQVDNWAAANRHVRKSRLSVVAVCPTCKRPPGAPAYDDQEGGSVCPDKCHLAANGGTE